MKFTNKEVIKSFEGELIDGIAADLDWETVEKLFMEKHGLPLGEEVSFKKGDITVHANGIAYLLEFDIKVPLSMLLDREGNCITFRTAPCSATEHLKEQEPEQIKASDTHADLAKVDETEVL